MYQDTGTWPVGHLPSFSPSVYHGCVYPSWTQTHVILFPLLSKCWDDMHMTPNCCIFTISFWQTHSFIFIIFTSSKWKCLLKYSSNAFWVAKNWSFSKEWNFPFLLFYNCQHGTQGTIPARSMLYHWATAPAQELHILWGKWERLRESVTLKHRLDSNSSSQVLEL